MNLNAESLNLGSFSEEVNQKYAFPDGATVHKFLNNEHFISKKDLEFIEKRDYRKTNLIIAFTTLGVFSYCYLLFPAGKVVRDRMEANFGKTRYWTRRILPFLGLAIPIAILRDSVRIFPAVVDKSDFEIYKKGGPKELIY